MIGIKSLKKIYNKGQTNQVIALDDVNLFFENSGMVAIFGKSGCGKTTLLNALGGLDSYDGGAILIDDELMKPNNDILKNKKIGYIFQNYYLDENVTCFDNVANSLLLCGVTDSKIIKERVYEALKLVGLFNYKNRLPSTLSGGQQQRVAIARAIVKNPEIILADEPTGNLDESNTIIIMELLKKISRKKLVVLVTHEEDLVSYYCDKIVNIVDGKVYDVKENKDKRTYDKKDKNDIYLGELKKQSTENDNFNIVYYGNDLDKKINLKIVNNNGKIYLKVDSEDVMVIDDSSEIKLHEGKFNKIKEYSDDNSEINLGEIEGNLAKCGKLYNFKSALKAGYSTNFVIRKRRNIFQRIVIVLFAFIFSFLALSLGTTIKSYKTVKDGVVQDIFYIHCSSYSELANVNNMVEDDNAHVDYFRLRRGSPFDREANIRFKLGNFNYYQSYYYTGLFFNNQIFLDFSLAPDRLLAGKNQNLQDNEFLISSYVADYLIKNAVVDYISSYNDLIGLYSEDNAFRIAGVVRDNSNVVYASKLAIANIDFISGGNLQSASLYGMDIGDYEIVVNNYSDFTYEYELDDTITLNGVEVKYVRKISNYNIKDGMYVGDKALIEMSQRLGNVSGGYSYFSSKIGHDYSVEPNNIDEYTYFAVLHSTNVSKTKEYIENHFESKTFYTRYDGEIPSICGPEQYYEHNMKDVRTSIISGVISMAFSLGIMSLCMYFVMRASMISRIKEIGILRAIGASKKNILYKFTIESLVFVFLTALVGFVIGVIFIKYLTVEAPLLANRFYLPIWYVLASSIVLLVICMVCGMIPIFNLNRKTASQILAKYDI